MNKAKFVLFVLLGMFLINHTIGQVTLHTSMPDYETNRVYLKLSSNITANMVDSLEISPAYVQNYLPDLLNILNEYGYYKIERPFKTLNAPFFYRTFRISFYNSNIDSLVIKLNAINYIELAEKIPVNKVHAGSNDPTQSYYLSLTNEDAASDIHQGGNAVVAIVDNAVLTSHDDLLSNIILGRDVANNDADPNPPTTVTPTVFSHGTHVAGIAGAVNNNGIGVKSIGWNNSIMPIKATLDSGPHSVIHNGYDGIMWAALNGADVINCSWGSEGYSLVEYTLITTVKQMHDVIIVASAGNNHTSTPSYPAAYGEGITAQSWEIFDEHLVVAVASLDQLNNVSTWGTNGLGQPSGSKFGDWIDVSAYGTGIVSCVADNNNFSYITDQYASYNGTSMASPQVAGLAGLMRSYRPNLSADEIIDCILNTANNDIYDLTLHPGNPLFMLGRGRIDAHAAMQCIDGTCANPFAVISSSGANLCPNSSVTLSCNNAQSYQWSTGANTQNIMVNATGTYSLTAEFAGGCSASASFNLMAADVNAHIIAIENSGLAQNDGILCGQGMLVLSSYSGTSYQWNTFGATTPGIPGTINAGSNLPFTHQFCVTITGVGGCPGVVDQECETIQWLQPPSATITPSNPTICSGGSINLTAIGGGTYQWASPPAPAPANTATINVAPISATTFTVTVTDNFGCTASANSTVSINSGLSATITLGTQSPCTGQVLTVSVTPSGSYTYQWQLNGSSIPGATLSSYSATQNGTYTVVVTSNFGCTAIASANVTLSTTTCCAYSPNLTSQQNTLLTFNSATNTAQFYGIIVNNFGASYGSTTTVGGVTYYTIQNFPYEVMFNNSLNVNAPLTFINCPNIRFSQNGRVYVQDIGTVQNSFELLGSKLKGCGSVMWKGIDLQNANTRFYSDEYNGIRNEIWDANYAIESFNGADFQAQHIDFVNNLIGLKLHNYESTVDRVHSCIFTSSANPSIKTHQSSPVNITGLTNGKAMFGIFLSNVPNVEIGLGQMASMQNKFLNINCGIYASGSAFRAANNLFENQLGFVAPNATPSTSWFGTGIFFTGTNSSGNSIVIGGGNGFDKNTFKYNYNGIRASTCQNPVSIIYNDFWHAIEADIHLNGCNLNPSIAIQHNNFEATTTFGDCIRLLSCTNSDIDVSHNGMTNIFGGYTLTNPLPQRVTGIVVAGYSNTTYPARRVRIHDNDISSVCYGIYSLNNRNVEIFNNLVRIMYIPYLPVNSYGPAANPLSDFAGIMSSADRNVTIRNNWIVDFASAQTTYLPDANLTDKIVGISVTNNSSLNGSPAATISCNAIQGTHWAVAATGSNTGGVSLRNNGFQGAQVGIAVYNNGVIGNQGAATCPTGTGPCTLSAPTDFTPDNTWTSCIAHLGAFNANASSQRILMRSNGGAGFGWGTQFNPALSTGSGCTNPNAAGSGLNQIAQSLAQFFAARCTNIPTNHPAYPITNCGTFGVTPPPGEEMLRQLDVLEKMAKGETDTYDPENEEDYKKWREYDLIETIERHPELKQESYTLDTFYTARQPHARLNRLAEIMDEAHTLIDDSTAAQQLLSRNQSIDPADIKEQNMQRLNDLYLRHFASKRHEPKDSTVRQALRGIAAQCYLKGGPAVFMARALYWEAIDDVDWAFHDQCLISTGAYKTNSETYQLQQELVNNFSCRVYPNPVQAEKVVYIEITEPAKFRLFDNLGRVVLSSDLTRFLTSLDVSSLSSGLYSYQVVSETGHVKSAKLIIKNE